MRGFQRCSSSFLEIFKISDVQQGSSRNIYLNLFQFISAMDGKKLLDVAQNIRTIAPQQIPKLVQDIRNAYKEVKEDLNTLGNSLYKLSLNIMNMGEIRPESLPYYEKIIDDIILCAIQNKYQVGFDAIKNIFNTNAQFYKKADLDIGLKYPIGRDRPLQSYKPSVGQQCDVVKPYITSTSYCGWIRCTVLEIEGSKYTLLYMNSMVPITTKQQPFFAPLGTRTSDFDWRAELDVGSPIEAQTNRMWIESTVVATKFQNNSKKVQVSFRRFAQNGDRSDSEGNKYFGLGPNEDEWMDIFSPRIQQNGKMAHKKLCYYSANCDEVILDDNYDIIFQKQYEQKPFHGILRTIFIKSLSYIRFMNTFTKNKGFQTLFEIMENPPSDISPIFFMQSAIASFVNFIPRMDIFRYLPKLYSYAYNFFKNNAKSLTLDRIDNSYFCIDTVGKRLMSLSQVHRDQNQIRKLFVTIFLKQNMQKQMLALKYLMDLINPKKPYTEREREELDEFILRQRLFYQIFQTQTHEQILSRTPYLLKYLMEKKIVQREQIEYLWNLAPYKDQRTRAIIQRILSEISKELPIGEVQNLLEKLLQLKQTQLTFDNLNLLRELKNRQITPEYQLRILTYLWDIITKKSDNIKTNIEEEVEKVFKAFVAGIKSPEIRINVLESMISRLTETKKVQREVDLLRDFISSYPQKIVMKVDPTDAPLTKSEAISYLINHQIYDKLLNLILNEKKDMVVTELLKFLGFLFEYDTEDASHIIQQIYDKFGPSDILLQWIEKNLKKAQNFVMTMLQSYEKVQGFVNLSTSGFQALTQIIIAVNEKAKKMKVMTTFKYSTNQTSSTENKNTGTQTSQSKPGSQKMIGPVLPNKVKHLFILVSPFQLVGMKFLSNLLHVLKNSKVYNEAVKLIIKFIISLDDSLEDKTLQFRQQFLGEIIQEIDIIFKKNEFNDEIKQKMMVYINLLIEVFAQTEKNGLGNVSPHFEKLIGEKLTFNVENTCPQPKATKVQKFTIVMNQNDTLWRLKLKVAQIIGENPLEVDIIKFVNPVDDGYMGKSLIDLFFYDGEGIKAAKKPIKEVPKHNLLNEDGTDLSERFLQIVVNWFEEYKNKDNHMTYEDLKTLAEVRWRGSLLKQPDKLEKIMEQHDKQKKGYLTFDDFKDFYYTKAVKNENAVWKLIHLSGYRNNLRQTATQVKELDSNTLPRRILSTSLVYDLIFQIFRNPIFEPVQMNFYKLLSELEVDPQTKSNIQSGNYKVIDESDSIFEFSYAIEIANSLISRIGDFYFEFWKNHRCEKVLRRVQKIMENTENIYKLDTHVKNTVLPNLIKSINFFMKYLFSDKPINRFLSTLKLNFIDTDDLQKKQEKFKETEQEIKQSFQIQSKLEELNKDVKYEEFYQTALSLLNNLIRNFTSDSTDFLPKLTVEVVRLIGYIALGRPSFFSPTEIIQGSKSQSLNYRRTTANLIYIYIREHSTDVEKLLMKMLEEMPNQAKHIYGNYFSFLSKIVEFYLSKHMQSQEKDGFFSELANNLLDRLFQKIEGQSRTAMIGDKIILGLLSTVLVLLKKQSIGHALKHRKHQITEKCLFAYGIEQKIQKLEVTEEMLKETKQSQHFQNYVKCKTEQTRKVAYDIVSKLHQLTAKEDPDFIEKYIFPIFETFSGEVRITDSKSLSVGLKNFGSTCYMNSMLQVLNAVGPFRNMLLQAKSQSQLVKELQKTFSALFFSQRIDYAPRKVLEAFVPPINPGIQQDTTQFLNFLFDQLETGLATTEYKKLLDEIFKGAATAQMICSNCGYRKQNRQEFFPFSIQIDGRYDLAQALQHSHDGEIISQYLCDSCQQRCDMKKRNLLAQVPNIFFIHLRRIVFNYDMFINQKIHTRLQFPNQLNIQPFTKEGVELRQSLGLEYIKNLAHNEEEMKKFEEMTLHGKQKDFYKLKLKGVIVHSGSADVGHYYSILSSSKNNTWFKYDDSRVSVFTMSGFQNQCYGGTWQTEEWGGFGSSTNAYFLVYEKVVKKPIRLFQNPTQNGIEEEISIQYDESKIFNTVEQYKSVWLDNHRFMVESHLLQQSHAKGFMKFINQLLLLQTSSNKIVLISQILYKLAIHSEEVGELQDIFMKCSHEISTDIFSKYIVAEKKKTFKLLFSHNKNLRHFMGIYLSTILFHILQKSQDEALRKQVFDFIGEYLHNTTGEVAKNWLRIDGFFIFLDNLVVLSEKNQQLWDFFMKYHLISLLIDFVMEKSSPVKIGPKNYSLGTKTNPVDFSVPLKTITYLVKHSYGFNGENYELPPVPQERLFHLNDNDIICLGYGQFYRKMLKQRQNMTDLGILIQRLCIKNLPYSTMISEAIITMIGSNTDMSDEMQDFSFIVVEILKIRDQFWRNRAQMILGISTPFVLEGNTMATLDQERYIFTSTIYEIFPVECLFAFVYLYRLKNPLGCFYLGKAILQGCSVTTEAMQYLIKQPSSTYYFDSYLDWIQQFILSIESVTMKEKVRERVLGDQKEILKYVEDYKDLKKQKNDLQLYCPLITGAVFDKKTIYQMENQGIEVNINEYEVYCLDSHPAYHTNTALDTFLDGGRLIKPIDPQSNILKFMKNPKKSFALKMQAVEENQDKQLVGLFDQEFPTQPQQGIQTEEHPIQIQNVPEKSKVQPPKQSQQENIEEASQEKLNTINIEGYYTTNYYREIEIINRSKSSKYVKFSFPNNPVQTSNMILPLSFAYKISTKSNERMWIGKQDYQKEWVPIKFRLQVEEFVKEKHEKNPMKINWFKLYGYVVPEQQHLGAMKPQMVIEQQKKKEEEPKKQEGGDITQISCPICTFFNLSINVTCEMCGEKLM